MSGRALRCDLGDVTLHGEVTGAGRTVLLIHGGAEDGTSFAAVAEQLEPDFEVVTYDRRGTGRSGKGAGWPRIGVQRHADDAGELLRRLHTVAAVCCGTSSGAIVALAMAARHSEVVEHVVSFEPPLLALAPGGGRSRERLLHIVRSALREHPGDYGHAYEMFARTVHGADWSTLREHTRNQQRGYGELFVEDDLELMTRYCPRLDLLASGGTEVTIGAGIWSVALLAEVANRVATRIGTKVAWLESSHGVHRERPDLLAALIRERACSRRGGVL